MRATPTIPARRKSSTIFVIVNDIGSDDKQILLRTLMVFAALAGRAGANVSAGSSGRRVIPNGHASLQGK
jgi:hypothetical protein